MERNGSPEGQSLLWANGVSGEGFIQHSIPMGIATGRGDSLGFRRQHRAMRPNRARDRVGMVGLIGAAAIRAGLKCADEVEPPRGIEPLTYSLREVSASGSVPRWFLPPSSGG